MANIGGQSFFSLVGAIKGPGPQLLDITSPGVAGVSFAVVQWRGEPTTVRALRFLDSVANVAAYRLAFENLRGYVVSVTDDWGDTRPYVLVHDCREIEVVEVANSTTGVYGYMWWEFTLEELW